MQIPHPSPGALTCWSGVGPKICHPKKHLGGSQTQDKFRILNPYNIMWGEPISQMRGPEVQRGKVSCGQSHS